MKTLVDTDVGVQSLTEPDKTVYDAVSVAEDELEYASDKNVVIIHAVSVREVKLEGEQLRSRRNKHIRWNDR